MRDREPSAILAKSAPRTPLLCDIRRPDIEMRPIAIGNLYSIDHSPEGESALFNQTLLFIQKYIYT